MKKEVNIKLLKSKGVFGVLILMAVISLLSLTLIHQASASNPSYTMTNLLDDEVENGENDFGNLLFVSEDYIPDNHIFSIFENKTVQRFDVMKWQGVESIIVVPPFGDPQTLVIGNSYIFDYQGNYLIESVTNSSKNFKINSTPEDSNTINLTAIDLPNGISVNFKPNNFILTSEQAINVNLSVDDDLNPDDYSLGIEVKNANEFDITQQDFTLKSIKKWEIFNSTIGNKTYKTGDSEFYGFLDLENIGNEDIEITTTKSGNETHLIGISQSQTLYRKSNLRLNFQIQIPTVQDSGDYDLEIKVSGGDTNITIPVTITVQDSLMPVIESINFSTDVAYKDNEIVVIATDNNDVDRVILSYDNLNISMYKDGNTFKTKQKFIKLSRYIFEFCAYDDVNNTHCQGVNKTFIKDEVLGNVSAKLDMPSKKVGTYSKIKMFEITQEIDEEIGIELLSITALGIDENAQKPLVRIIDNDGTVKAFSEFTNEIFIQDKGNVFIEVRNEYVADFDGIIRVNVPEYVQEIQDISFEVSFKEYDIPQDFTETWLDDRPIECLVKDTGNLDTSVYKCSLEFPIDVKPEDLSFPTTVSEKRSMDTDVEEIEAQLSQQKRRAGTIISIILVFLIVTISLSYFLLFTYPYVRFKKNIKVK